MRTAEQIRDRLLEHVRLAVARPSMFAADGHALETLATTLISFVAFADGGEDDGRREHLRRYGKEGITGPFSALFGRDERLVNEVGAVMAHHLHRLGYLDVDQLLDPEFFQQVRSEIRDRFDEVDLFASQIKAELGEPSFQIKDHVWAYGSSDVEAGWIFLSFRPDPEPTYEPGTGRWTYHRDIDRLLRFVWTSEGPFEETLALPTRTKLEIWGPGWDWNHGWRSKGGAPSGVRESLQDIHDADPSQRLRRPGFAE